MGWRRWCWIAMLAVLLSPAPAAWAQPGNQAEAERLFAAGDQAYDAGKYLAAAGAYENAYKLHPVASITFSIAQAYRRHYFEDPNPEWLLKAQDLYRRYLTEQATGGRRAHAVTHLNNIAVLLAAQQNQATPDGPKASVRTEILVASTVAKAQATIDDGPPGEVPVVQVVTPGPHRVRVFADGYFDTELDVIASEGRLSVVPTELKPRPGGLKITASPSDAQIWIDGQLKGEAAKTALFELAPGRHSLAIGARGHDLHAQSLEVRPGQQQTVHAELNTSRERVAAYAMFGTAGGFALVGAALAAVAAVSESEAIDARAGTEQGRALTPAEAARSNSALARRDLTRTLSAVGFGVAGAAGITGTLLFTLDHPKPTESTALSTPGATVAWRGSF